MTVTSESSGWKIVLHNEQWVYSDTMEPFVILRPCHNCREDQTHLIIKHVRPDGREKQLGIWVDACIAPIVKALNKHGVYTIASCCGHGKMPGSIVLADGREIIIVKNSHERDIVFSACLKKSE